MPTERFMLEFGGPRLLEVAWERGFNNFRVTYDGQPVAFVEKAKQLRTSHQCTLPDGSTLVIHLGENIAPELHILWNGKELPEIELIRHIRTAGRIAFALSGVSITISALQLMMGEDPLGSVFAAVGFGVGIAFGLLSYFIHRRSLIAAIIAEVILIILLMASIYYALVTGDLNPGIVVIILAAVFMMRGVSAAAGLKRGGHIWPNRWP